MKVYESAPAIRSINTLETADAVTPVVPETKLKAAATSLALAPALTLAVLVPKKPLRV